MTDPSFNTIWALTTVYVVVLVCITIVMSLVVLRIPREHGKTLRLIFERIELVKLSAVLIIIISASYLAFLNLLSEGIIALFSGISAYLLGTVKSGSAKGDAPTEGE